MASSVDPDYTQRYQASDLGVHCIQRPSVPNTLQKYLILLRFVQVKGRNKLKVNGMEMEISAIFYTFYCLIFSNLLFAILCINPCLRNGLFLKERVISSCVDILSF